MLKIVCIKERGVSQGRENTESFSPGDVSSDVGGCGEGWLVEREEGVEGLVPKLGEKIPEESYKDQKAKVDGFFPRCL